ncbi:hypothetical protein BT63DRAFT_424769 [Microthyrium microscopicum]|uniref:Uncharacterized protein n=1 Tax=Microthyrium microscopicum TaxID=703497 RepID=A0A6A6UBS1_9PEZI|nr:hypothetical protein BT63DRAFT_424769 [Microthyrium microscopicum]
MDQQLDQIVIGDFLEPLRRRLLSELQEKMSGQNKEHSFEIFLTVYVLNTNLEWCLRHSRRNAIRYDSKERYGSTGLAQEYIEGHNILMSHFLWRHKGSPLDPSFKSTSKLKRKDIGLSDSQVVFLREIRALFSSQDEYLRALHEDQIYEQELYWSSRLFIPGWMPHSGDIIPETQSYRRLIIRYCDKMPRDTVP